MELKVYVEITRPINCILASLTVVIGLFNINAYSNITQFFMNPTNQFLFVGGILVYLLIAGASNVINDYFDVEIDRINRPNRPIPREDITKKSALYYYIILIVISVILSFPLGFYSPNQFLIPIIAIFFAFIGFFYAWRGKAWGVPGNIIVGISFSFGIPFGSLLLSTVAEIPQRIWFFFLTSTFILISRELVKGMEDVKGDRKYNIKTVANSMGTKAATFFSILFSISGIITFTTPVIILNMNILFIIFMIIGDLIVIISILILSRNYTSKNNQKKSSLLLKIGAFCGLLAYFLAFF
ncbi:MAG: geranylgeranylglycerol-phosphate geranylgeranyltransferase [Promethearchaeota archaeon]